MAAPPSSPLIITRRRQSIQYFTEDLGNGIGLDMVLIPAGTFIMGSPTTEEGRDDDEGPQHRVTIPQPFCMGRYPITQAQYEAVTGSNPAYFKNENRPVESVSWHDAVAFCQQLSTKTGRIYRLPSEAEWEYACRAGTTTPYHFGPQLTREVANFSGNETTEVGSFGLANAFGLYDLHGNVWEWCADYWHQSYKGAPIDGTAWIKDGDEFFRVLRGGSWYVNPRYCRSAIRNWLNPDNADDDNGFRVVCSAPRI